MKRKLIAALELTLDPMRQRRADLLSRPDAIRDIIADGSRKARLVARETMARVREAMKLSYR